MSTLLPPLGCLCATSRRMSRLLTQLYSHEMGSKLEPSQFALLSALKQSPASGQASFGRALGLDKTTMSRNMRVLEKHGWIEPIPSGDRRERGFRVSAAGERLLSAAKPGWTRAQTKMRDALQPDEWDTLLQLLDRVSAAALKAAATS